MKRIIAFFIDYFIFTFLFTMIVLSVLFTASLQGKQDDLWMAQVVLHSLMGAGFALVLYFGVLDYWSFLDCGKKIMKIELLRKQKPFSIGGAFLHATLKTITSMLWPISIVYFLVKSEMPYDKLLKLTIKDNTAILEED